MGVGLSGRGIGYHGDMANNVVGEEAVGENHGICSRETSTKTLYRRRAHGWVQ